MWSLFSSAPARRRLLILRGLLTIACPSQLTFLQEMLTLEMRLDPLSVLPREVSLKIFTNLDPISLGRAAQVSKSWKSMADDDLLWRTMCEQHIEKKCDKCGWGLPLLSERRRKARTGKTADKAPKAPTTSTVIAPAPSTFVTPYRGPVPDLATLLTDKLTAADDSSSSTSTSAQPMSLDPPSYANSSSNSSIRPPKRAKTESPGPSCCTTPAPSVPSSPRAFSRKPSMTLPPVPSTRPWKAVYCERLAVERNWRKGIYVPEVLSGHTDAITCLQVAEDLPHPNFPVLMTGSWDRSVRIWNLESGKEVGILRGHTRGIRALQFDALKLVTGSMDSTLKIWNWRTGECMRTLRGHNDAVICLTYDRQLLVSGSADSTIRVWDFGTGEGYTLRGHTEWVNSVALWDSKEGAGSNGHVVEGDIGAATSNPEAAKASSKGKFLISASDDMTIRVWDLYTRECVRVLKGHVAQVQSLRVTTSEEDHIAFPPSVNHPSSHSSSGLPLPSPDPNDKNRHQVVAGNAYEGFFDTPASSCQATSSTSPRPASLLPRPSLHLASALPPTPTGQIASAHARAANQPRPDNSTLPFLALEGDKKPWIVSASLDNTIKVWDVEAGVCQRTMFGHIEGVWDVDVDKLRIASASHDRTLKVSFLLVLLLLWLPLLSSMILAHHLAFHSRSGIVNQVAVSTRSSDIPRPSQL